MKKVIIIAAAILSIVSAQAQVVFVKDNTTGQIKIQTKVDSVLLRSDINSDLLKTLPGTPEQKLEALQHPGKKIVVAKKDTSIYHWYYMIETSSTIETYLIVDGTTIHPIKEGSGLGRGYKYT